MYGYAFTFIKVGRKNISKVALPSGQTKSN